MLGIYVTVPVACFRKGLAREYLETELLPPPSTCYGFLLSLVGEEDRRRHVGARVCPVLLNRPSRSVVLRTVWRVKSKPLGSPGNTRPDFQQLLTGVELLIWLDSSQEKADGPTLQQRVQTALEAPEQIRRYGGLSLGESTHLVDQVKRFSPPSDKTGTAFLLKPRGPITLPVWVDHVGAKNTRYVTGELVESFPLDKPPAPDRMPRIEPPAA